MDFTPTLLRHLEAGCDGQPDNPDLQFALGGALQNTGEFESAIGRFSQVIDLAPQRPDAWVHRAMCFVELDLLAEAHTDLENASQLLDAAAQGQDSDLQPRLRQTWTALAAKWVPTDVAKAEAVFRRLLPVVTDAEMLEAFYAYSNACEPESAWAFYTAARESGSTFSTDYVTLFARLLAKDGVFTHAISMLEESRRTNAQNTTTLLELGWIYFLSGNNTQAADVLRSAVKLAPKHAQGYCSLAWVLSSGDLTQSDAEEAITFAERMLPLDGYPEDRKLKVLARCQLRLEKPDEARDTISRAIKVATPDQLPILQGMLP